ncbi:MAG: cell filamentation protein [Pseudonocardiales bacterium]|nr:cell filamentation protein [Pseudonocardiales bacterium]
MKDPYFDPNRGVLFNRLGITDPGELAHAEANFTSVRIFQLWRHPLPGRYDLPHLQAFHRHIFGDVYDWAGELRTVTIIKGGLFCLPQHLISAGEEVYDKLARAEHLRGLGRPAFLDGLTKLLADINGLHPFRDGNGRTQRAFLAQFARDAGHIIRWSVMDPATNVEASRAAHRDDSTPLHEMLEQLVDHEVPHRA